MPTAEKQAVLTDLLRSLVESEGPETLRRMIVYAFAPQPNQPKIAPPRWLAALLDMNMPLPDDDSHSQLFLAKLERGLDEYFNDDYLPEGYVDANVFFDSVKKRLTVLLDEDIPLPEGVVCSEVFIASVVKGVQERFKE